MNKKTFLEEVKKLGIDITEKQVEQLDKYYELLIEANKNINLTRIIEKEEVYLKHFYDSLTITKVIDLKKEQTNAFKEKIQDLENNKNIEIYSKENSGDQNILSKNDTISTQKKVIKKMQN